MIRNFNADGFSSLYLTYKGLAEQDPQAIVLAWMKALASPPDADRKPLDVRGLAILSPGLASTHRNHSGLMTRNTMVCSVAEETPVPWPGVNAPGAPDRAGWIHVRLG